MLAKPGDLEEAGEARHRRRWQRQLAQRPAHELDRGFPWRTRVFGGCEKMLEAAIAFDDRRACIGLEPQILEALLDCRGKMRPRALAIQRQPPQAGAEAQPKHDAQTAEPGEKR